MASDLKRQGGVQQKPSQGSALANRTISAGTGARTSQRQLARILGHHDVAARSPTCREFDRVTNHRVGGHRRVAQETRELHLPRPPSAQPTDTATRLFNQGRMQDGPPFSRRRSPNRPSPNSNAIDTSENQ